MQALWISLFGVVGILSRYAMDTWTARVAVGYPLSTFAINISGSFLAGLLYAFGTERGGIPLEIRNALMIGLLGGFTTFSAYSLQSARLLEAGQIFPGLFYFLSSPALGLVAAFLGLSAGRIL